MVQGRRKRPLNALVITRERLQEVLDDAVERGRMTRDDASDLFGELVRRGTGGIVGGARRPVPRPRRVPLAGGRGRGGGGRQTHRRRNGGEGGGGARQSVRRAGDR